MNRVIKNEVDYLTEAFSLLNLIAGEKGIADLRQSLGKKHDLSSPEITNIFELLAIIEKDAKKSFKKKMEQVQYYFYHVEDELSLAGLTLLWEGLDVPRMKSVDDLAKHLNEMTEEEYCKSFGMYLKCWASRTLFDFETEQEDNTQANVMQRLLKMNIPDEKKVQIQDIFWNREPHRNEVFELLTQAEKVLHRYDEVLKRETQQFSDYWMTCLPKQDFLSYINEELGVSIEEKEVGYEVWPLIINANTASFMSNGDEDKKEKEPDIFRLGLLFSAGIPLGTKVNKDEMPNMEEYVSQVLKLLADKSKFEILCYVKDKSAYGSELAKHLGLTTATISHHMGALINKGLVCIEKVDNRIYYRGDKTNIEKVLNYCRQTLISQ